MNRQSTSDDMGDLSGDVVEMAPAINGDSTGERHDARPIRVRDFQASSLAKDDPLEANLGSINSGLMRVALLMDEAIEEAIPCGPRMIESVKRMLPEIESYLKITRQVDRFAQLEVRIAEARKPKVDEHAAEKIEAAAPLGLPASESEEIDV